MAPVGSIGPTPVQYQQPKPPSSYYKSKTQEKQHERNHSDPRDNEQDDDIGLGDDI